MLCIYWLYLQDTFARTKSKERDKQSSFKRISFILLTLFTWPKGIDSALKTPMCSSQTARRNFMSCFCVKGRITKQLNNRSPKDTAENWDNNAAYLEKEITKNNSTAQIKKIQLNQRNCKTYGSIPRPFIRNHYLVSHHDITTKQVKSLESWRCNG